MKALYYILALSIFITACNEKKAEQSTLNNPPVLDTVTAFVLKAQPVKTGIQLPGELKPYNKARLFPKVPGYVKEMKADIGTNVSRGQVLAVLEAPELNSKHAEAVAIKQAASAKYQTSKDQWKRLIIAAKTPNAVAPFDIEKAKNQMHADSAQLESAKQLMNSSRDLANYLVIKSPFNGKITQRSADAGDFVNTSSLIFTVEEQSNLRLQVSVPEIYAAANPNTEIKFSSDAFPGKTFEARLARTAGAIDEKTRTELWEFEVQNRNNELKSGMFVNVVLELKRENPGFVISPVAVVTTLEKKFVCRIKNNRIEWVPVKQGFMLNKQIEIFGTLNDGDTILVRGTDEIKPQTKVVGKLVSSDI